MKSDIAIAIDKFTLRLRYWTPEFHGNSEMRYKLCLMGEIHDHTIFSGNYLSQFDLHSIRGEHLSLCGQMVTVKSEPNRFLETRSSHLLHRPRIQAE